MRRSDINGNVPLCVVCSAHALQYKNSVSFRSAFWNRAAPNAVRSGRGPEVCDSSDPLIDLSSIVVKGKYAGVLGKPPFRADVTRLLRTGPNDLIVRVANFWPNRLIGDKQPNAVPVAFTTFNPYNANLPLMDSGLLGPVAFLRIARGSPRARH
jgi:hypothetical protein